MSIPKKNDYMINPLTKRNIRVGSRIWINLVKDEVIQGQYSDDNILAETEELSNLDDDTITDKINELTLVFQSLGIIPSFVGYYTQHYVLYPTEVIIPNQLKTQPLSIILSQ